MPILSTIVGYFKDRDNNISVECPVEKTKNDSKVVLEEDVINSEEHGDMERLDAENQLARNNSNKSSGENDSDVSFHDACESFLGKDQEVPIMKTEDGDQEVPVGKIKDCDLVEEMPENKDDILNNNEIIIKNNNSSDGKSCNMPMDSSDAFTDAIDKKNAHTDKNTGSKSTDVDNNLEKSSSGSTGKIDTSNDNENSKQPVAIENEDSESKNQPVKDKHGKSVANEEKVKEVKGLTRKRKQSTSSETKTLTTQLLYGITPEMIEEENKYKAEEQKKLEEIRTKALAELQRTGKEKRFARLQLLLSRSQMYSTYLLGRLNARREAEQKRMARMEKKQEEELEKSNSEPEGKKNEVTERKDENKGKSTRGKRKRKEVDEEPAKQSSKKQKVTAKKKSKNNTDSENDPKQEKITKTDPKQVVDFESVQKLYYNRTLDGENVPPLQPLMLTGGVMRSYQIEGMTWLLGLFEHGINGILADEMGLGKTLQSIALIVSLIERGVKGPFLIAAPLSTLPNWISEFKKFAPELYTILYHGSIPERTELRRKMMRLKRYSHGFYSLPVVISSYEVLMRDRPVLDVYNIEWKFLIVDEGHRIKNLNCRLVHELKQYNTANRLLLTGTPLQNNLTELWSLLNYLLPDIFDDLRSFEEWFDFSAVTDGEATDDFVEKEKEGNVLQTLHSILTPFLLRRLKTDVDLTIPPKKEVYVYAPLTVKQETFYKSTLDRTIFDLIAKTTKKEDDTPKEFTKSGRAKRKSAGRVNYQEVEDENIDFDVLLTQMEENEKRKIEELEEKAKKEKPKSLVNIRLQNIMMQLRKCCNHPYLLEYPFNPETDELRIDEELIQVSGKMLILDRMLPELKKRGHKVLIFSQMTLMLDILGDYCSLRQYSYSRIDGTMDVKSRQDNIASFDEDPECFVFLLSTRSGGLGLNLMMADTCIIYDSDWNPQVDLQAQDRCHRIGQKKPVVIYRFVTANTIDQRIIERASSKRKLEKLIIHKKHFKGTAVANGISPTELLALLESKDVNNSHDTGSNIISDGELEKLLDRSDMQDWNTKKKKGGELGQNDETKEHVKTAGTETDVESTVESGVFKVIATEQTEKINF